MTKPTQRQVKIWILGVMNRQGMFNTPDPKRNEADAAAAVASSLMAFVDRYPREAFCVASMDAVCASEAYWNEAKIVKALDAWWSQNSPDTAMSLPPEAEQAPVSSEAKQWLAMWYRAKDDFAGTRALDLIRAHSPEAWAYLMNDHRATSIAVMHKWTSPRPSDFASEWDDPDRIEAAFQKAKAGLQTINGGMGVMTLGIAYTALVTAVRVHAPQWLYLVDPKRLREVDAPVTVAALPVVAVPSGLFD